MVQSLTVWQPIYYRRSRSRGQRSFWFFLADRPYLAILARVLYRSPTVEPRRFATPTSRAFYICVNGVRGRQDGMPTTENGSWRPQCRPESNTANQHLAVWHGCQSSRSAFRPFDIPTRIRSNRACVCMCLVSVCTLHVNIHVSTGTLLAYSYSGVLGERDRTTPPHPPINC